MPATRWAIAVVAVLIVLLVILIRLNVTPSRPEMLNPAPATPSPASFAALTPALPGVSPATPPAEETSMVVPEQQALPLKPIGQMTSEELMEQQALSHSAPCDPPVGPVVFGEGQDVGIAQRLKDMFEADQAGRRAEPIDWGTLSAEDRARRAETLEYLRAGKLADAATLYYAAMIFQHGNCPDHYQLAHMLTERALQQGEERARWLYAASLDRYLMSLGKPQKFGTQSIGMNGEMVLYPVDPATTDEERRRYNVPPLAPTPGRSMLNGGRTNRT